MEPWPSIQTKTISADAEAIAAMWERGATLKEIARVFQYKTGTVSFFLQRNYRRKFRDPVWRDDEYHLPGIVPNNLTFLALANRAEQYLSRERLAPNETQPLYPRLWVKCKRCGREWGPHAGKPCYHFGARWQQLADAILGEEYLGSTDDHRVRLPLSAEEQEVFGSAIRAIHADLVSQLKRAQYIVERLRD